MLIVVCWKYANFAAEAILLGFQHYLVMLGTTVLIPTYLVPQMGGGKVLISSLIPYAVVVSNCSI